MLYRTLLKTSILLPLMYDVGCHFSTRLLSLKLRNQISKVHLNDTGNIVIVNLEPSLVVSKTRNAKNDMPYWLSWQEICIEVR
jgi:hypothetical protein